MDDVVSARPDVLGTGAAPDRRTLRIFLGRPDEEGCFDFVFGGTGGDSDRAPGFAHDLDDDRDFVGY